MGGIRRMVRLAARFFWRLLPILWRVLRMMFFLATTSLTSIWVGIPQAVRRIADHWVIEATAAGMPHTYSQTIRVGGLVAASITLFLGWLILASFTAFLLGLVF